MKPTYHPRKLVLLVAVTMGSTFAANAQTTDGVAIVQATAPAKAEAGGDVPLTIRLDNTGAADTLRRINCDAAFFAEMRVAEVGEGGKASRVVRSIPIPTQRQLELGEDTHFVKLLQTNKSLAPGDHFNCAASFEKSGKREFEVTVVADKPAAAHGTGQHGNR
jgi:copper(I)-binding protein